MACNKRNGLVFMFPTELMLFLGQSSALCNKRLYLLTEDNLGIEVGRWS